MRIGEATLAKNGTVVVCWVWCHYTYYQNIYYFLMIIYGMIAFQVEVWFVKENVL